MVFTELTKNIWQQVARPLSLDRGSAARHHVDRPGKQNTWIALQAQTEAMPNAAVESALVMRALPPPKRLRRASNDHASRKAAMCVTGRLQQNPRKDAQADAVFRQAKSLTLTDLPHMRGARVGAINNVLRRTPNLVALSICTDLTAEEVFDLSLELVPHLRALDLRYNRFGDAGAKALALECLPRLQRLSLAGCGLTQAGVEALRLDCVQLEELDLRVNPVSDDAMLCALAARGAFCEQVIVDAASECSGAATPRSVL